MDVTGRTAIVTGGGGGIGAAIAHELVRRGARVVVADCDGNAASRVAGQLVGLAGDLAVDVCADVANRAAVEAMVTYAEETFVPVSMYFPQRWDQRPRRSLVTGPAGTGLWR